MKAKFQQMCEEGDLGLEDLYDLHNAMYYSKHATRQSEKARAKARAKAKRDKQKREASSQPSTKDKGEPNSPWDEKQQRGNTKQKERREEHKAKSNQQNERQQATRGHRRRGHDRDYSWGRKHASAQKEKKESLGNKESKGHHRKERSDPISRKEQRWTRKKTEIRNKRLH